MRRNQDEDILARLNELRELESDVNRYISALTDVERVLYQTSSHIQGSHGDQLSRYLEQYQRVHGIIDTATAQVLSPESLSDIRTEIRSSIESTPIIMSTMVR